MVIWDFFCGKEKKEMPPNAEVCSSCGGSGVMDEENFDLMQCNECLGVGWIVPIEDEELLLEEEEHESDADYIMNSIIHGDDEDE